MSEYQYYEFAALDRPLTSKEMVELRAISTRAEITATRFRNEYQWGDLEADPRELVERYFDAHVYFANWGSRRLILRIPKARVDVKALSRYFVGDGARCRSIGRHVVVELWSETEEPEDDFGDAGPGSLVALSLLRSELMRGDLRPAYLAWLLAVQGGDVDDGAQEPPVPAGLGELTAAQQGMMDFLRIDGDLVAAATSASPAMDGRDDGLHDWVMRQSQAQKDDWLSRAVDEPELPLGGELLRAFRASRRAPAGAHRSVGELRALVDETRARRERADAARMKRAAAAAERARGRRLDKLARDVDAAWEKLETLVLSSRYDEAVQLAIDLRDLARDVCGSRAFTSRFEAMRKRQTRRRGFFDRWKRATENAR